MSGTVLAAQLYTLREFLKTPPEVEATFKKVKQIGYDVVQASGLGSIAPKELRRIADDAGIEICATHVAADKAFDQTEELIEEHGILGCRNPAIGSMPPAARRDIAALLNFVKQADRAGRRLREAGMTLSYHNHDFEFEKVGGRLIMDILFGDTDPRHLQAELDVCWVQRGGGDPAAWIRKLAGRQTLLHLKDMTMREGKPIFAEVGAGNLNWPAILEAARAAGVRWYIVEQDACERDPFESLAISLRNLRAMGLR